MTYSAHEPDRFTRMQQLGDLYGRLTGDKMTSLGPEMRKVQPGGLPAGLLQLLDAHFRERLRVAGGGFEPPSFGL